jgi:spore coat-associated protein N
VKKKLAAFSLATVMGVSAIVGGTYAFFSDTEQSNGNMYSAGTLSLESMRNDLPTEGPMFYTGTSPSGVMGTGLWKPGDAHTRGLFIENTGSLNGVLKKISATPEAASGSAAYDDAIEFAKQSIATISVLEPVDGEGTFDSTTYAEMLKQVNEWYNLRFDHYWYLEASEEGDLDIFEGLTLAAKVVQNIENEMVGKVFTTKVTDTLGNKTEIQGRVKKIINKKSLNQLVTTGIDVSSHGLKVTPGEQMYFAYTVKFLNLDPAVNNPLQGKEVKFTFASEFIQE